MRLISTALLLTIAIVLGIVIAVVDREPTIGEDQGAGLSLTRFPAELVDEMVIELAGTPDIVLNKDTETEKWTFAKPITDRANNSNINSLLDSLNHLTIQDEIYKDELGATEELSVQNLGLDGQNVIRVTLRAPRELGGEERDDYVVLIGNDAPQQNAIYARLTEDPRRPHIYVVSGNPRRYLEKPLIALRDRDLIETAPNETVRVVAKTPRGDIEITRRLVAPPLPWRITKPIVARADADLIEELLTELNAMSIMGVKTTGKLPGPPPQPIPDGSVALEIYGQQSDQSSTVYLSPNEQEPTPGPDGVVDMSESFVDVEVSGRPDIFRVQSNILKDFPENLTAFRDRHLGNFPPQLVGQIYIKSRTDPLVRLESTPAAGGRLIWRSVRNNEKELANVDAINELLQRVNSELIVNFASDSSTDLAEYGLQDPAMKLVFVIRNPQVSDPNAENAWVTRTLNLGYGDEDGETLFGTFEAEPFVYQLDPSFVVPTNPLKWKNLKVLNFNQFNLVSIEREDLERENQVPIRLDYNFKTAQWNAYQEGNEVTEALNRDVANDLMTDLGSLTAETWVTSLGSSAYVALETPTARFKITLRERDEAAGKTRDVTRTLVLARSPSGYYGQIDGSLDVFALEGDLVRQLMRDLLGYVARPPE